MEAFADRISVPSEKQVIFQFAEQFPSLPVSQITQIVVSFGGDVEKIQQRLEELEKEIKNPPKDDPKIPPEKLSGNAVLVFSSRENQNGTSINVLPNLKLTSFQQFVVKKCNIKGSFPCYDII